MGERERVRREFDNMSRTHYQSKAGGRPRESLWIEAQGGTGIRNKENEMRMTEERGERLRWLDYCTSATFRAVTPASSPNP